MKNQMYSLSLFQSKIFQNFSSNYELERYNDLFTSDWSKSENFDPLQAKAFVLQPIVNHYTFLVHILVSDLKKYVPDKMKDLSG